jgi:NADPH-dependent curcumin reductase CurA
MSHPAPSPVTAREFHLAARPHGEPKPSDFRLVTRPLPPLAEGEVLVRNRFLSVDPYMRGRMNDVKSYVPPFALDAPMDGGAVGEVVASRAEALSPGDAVVHMQGWRDLAVGPAKAFRKVDAAAAPLSAFLGVLGMPGFTAYVGLFDVAGMREGETVFVSGAAGAVGSLVGQLARLRGAKRVIGSAGSAEKVRHLTGELGFDAAFDYRAGPVVEQLARAAPEGVDVYFDNVGGEHLEAAIEVMNLKARGAICGSISGYNATAPLPGPRNLHLLVGKRITLRGFLQRDHLERMPDFLREVGGWLREGKVRYSETVVDGLEHTPSAFIDMLRGKNTGKMVVRLG